MKNLQNRRGSTLPLVIILLAVLALSSANAVITMRSNTQLIAYEDYNSQAHQIAKSGTIAYTHYVIKNPASLPSLVDEGVVITVNNPPANFAPTQEMTITGTEVTPGVYANLTVQADVDYKSAADVVRLQLKNMTVTSLKDIFTKAVYANGNLDLDGLGALEGDVQTAGTLTVPGFYTDTATANSPIPLPAFNIYTPLKAGLVNASNVAQGGATVLNSPSTTLTGNQTINRDVTIINSLSTGNNRTVNLGATSTGRETFLVLDTLTVGNGSTLNIGAVGRTEDITIICKTLVVTGNVYVKSHVNLFVIGDNTNSSVDFNLQANATLSTLKDGAGDMIPDLLNIYFGNSDGTLISNNPKVNIQAKVDIAGYMYGPTASIDVNSGNVAVYGSLVADNVTANNNSEIYFKTPDDAYTPDNISEIFNQSTYLLDKYVE